MVSWLQPLGFEPVGYGFARPALIVLKEDLGQAEWHIAMHIHERQGWRRQRIVRVKMLVADSRYRLVRRPESAGCAVLEHDSPTLRPELRPDPDGLAQLQRPDLLLELVDFV